MAINPAVVHEITSVVESALLTTSQSTYYVLDLNDDQEETDLLNALHRRFLVSSKFRVSLHPTPGVKYLSLHNSTGEVAVIAWERPAPHCFSGSPLISGVYTSRISPGQIFDPADYWTNIQNCMTYLAGLSIVFGCVCREPLYSGVSLSAVSSPVTTDNKRRPYELLDSIC